MTTSDMSVRTAGTSPYVSLTTFRRTGEAVATPVWAAHDDGTLVVMTGPGSGKAKRLRSDPRVVVQPCDVRGQVPDGAPVLHGTAEILASGAGFDRGMDALRRAYGLQFRVAIWAGRLRRRGGSERVVLRITPTAR
ncbi:PPOX class F420-dependent oxidoreductase [Cellulosimicrobium terreum]|nr:PPOX class F420-dependent oxidoreductase [Cellulosimicrobium terreum]